MITFASNALMGLIAFIRMLKQICNSANTDLIMITADLLDEEVVRLITLKRGTEFIDVGLREQHAVSLAQGIAAINSKCKIILYCGDSLLYRAADQINSLAQGGFNVVIIGAMSGLTNSRNGSTHQSSGQPGALLTMPGITMLEPSDMAKLFCCLNWAINNPGVTYLRLHGGDWRTDKWIVPDWRKMSKCFLIRCCDTGKPSNITLVASGLATLQATKAAHLLERTYGICADVVDVVNLSNPTELPELLKRSNAILSIYNGNSIILGSVVANAIINSKATQLPKFKSLGFTLGQSGKLEELISHYGIDANGIAFEALRLIDITDSIEDASSEQE